MQALLDLATSMGLTVIEERVAHTSGYFPGDATIAITPGLPRRYARSILAHELGHHILGHRPTRFGPVHHRQERHANEWAAHHLISPHRYREVERLRDGHEPSMAHDLDVAPELLTVYRRMLQRIGDTVYVEARMGAGMWRHREAVA